MAIDGVSNDDSSAQRVQEAQRAQTQTQASDAAKRGGEDAARQQLAADAAKNANVQQWRQVDQHVDGGGDAKDAKDAKARAGGGDATSANRAAPSMPAAPPNAPQELGAVSERIARSERSERRAGPRDDVVAKERPGSDAKPAAKQSLRRQTDAAKKAIDEGAKATKKPSPSDRRKMAPEITRAKKLDAALKANGLPTRATGVPMRVSDSPHEKNPAKPSEHGKEVVRSAAGIGPGKGGNISLESVDPKGSPELAKKVDAGAAALEAGRGGRDAVVKQAENVAAQFVSQQQERVESMRQWARDVGGTGTKLAVTSTGQNALDVTNDALKSAHDGALSDPKSDAAKMFKDAGIDPKKLSVDKEGNLGARDRRTQQKLDQFRDGLAKDVQAKISSSPTVKAEQAKLEKSLADGRAKEKLLVFKSAGNGEQDGRDAGDAKLGRDFDNVKGFLTVAATESKNGKDTIAPFSSSGNEGGIAAPGANMPVTVKNGALKPSNGTSYAAPYAMGTAALMLKANPSLSPSQVEGILKETARDVVPGRTRDGYGAVNPVRALQRAKELAE